MPTYGYQCTACNHEFQVRQKMSDDPIQVCPECAGSVKRLLYPVGVVFKGTGWYVTDYASGEKADKEKAEKKEATADAPKTEPTKADAPKTDTPKAEAPKTESK